MQFTEPEDKLPLPQPKDINKLQQIIGAMLYYAREVYITLMNTINEPAYAQTNDTQGTMRATENLIDLFHTHSDATIRYFSSQMQLQLHRNVSYLLVSKARSRVGGHFYLSDHIDPSSPTKKNGAVLVVADILKFSMASAAEAELGDLFINYKESEVIRNMLEEIGHPQQLKPIRTDNSTASGIINETIKQRRSKAMDMRLY